MKRELNRDFIIWLSDKKQEDKSMLNFRLESFEKFLELENPKFGPKINLDFEKINYYKSDVKKGKDKL